jgi:uncharacterized repeat protein (TIGR03803 family)
MSMKQFRNIVLTVCLGCLAPSLAVAQPVINTQPTGQFIGPGATAVFSVSATGTPPLSYQLLFDGTADGTAVTGPGNYTFRVGHAQPSNSGYYSIIVSNASGSVTSQVAELKVFVLAPHSLSGIQAQSNGLIGLTFAGEMTALFAPYYDIYPLESSSNLVDWAPLATLQRTNAALNLLSFLDTNAPEFSQRFYRTPSNSLPTPDPQPTGPCPVGTFSMLLTNTNRSNAKFMVTFWYPAVAQAGVLPTKYVETQVAIAGYGNFTTQVEGFYSHSLSNAPLATNLAGYPVVLYDPGYGGHRRENTDKVEDLASWGYVVVGLDTSDTFRSVLPNGTVVDGQEVNSDASDNIYIQSLDAAIEGRLLDMQFVLDELESLNDGDPRLGGQLDLDKIGAFGWSIGGATTAQFCLRDSRCKAGAGMDGGFWETNVLTQPLNVPYLFFRSDVGPDLDPGGVLIEFPDDRLEVYNEQVTNAYWVKLVSTVHGSFCDYGLIYNSASLEAAFGTPLSGQILPGARVSQIVRADLLSFFNKFLQGEDDHLLDGPSPFFSEVMQFLSTSNFSAGPEYPSAGLVEGTHGNFYGTTAYGGVSGDGTVFEVTTNGTLTTLVSFTGTNGSHPVAALVRGSDGNYYGTTENGGTNGNNGTVFQMTPTGMLTTLVSFNGANGSYPVAALVEGANSNFYGTTMLGGADNGGTVFEMTYAGKLATLVSFDGANGWVPVAAMVQGINGNLYGTTDSGGDLSSNYGGGFGTVFEVTYAGELSTLVSFNGENGQYPASALVLDTNGILYGTTPYGGELSLNSGSGFGTVFRMSSSGALASLVSFNGANGSYSVGGLVQGSDGNFYGTTEGGGKGVGGTVFKMTPAGALTTLVSFNGTNGSGPAAGLVQGNDGNFYGTTEFGGTNGFGTVFQVTTNGTLTTLVSF